MHYRVTPGLYAVGHPCPESPVLVSANYKLSLDRLRSQLGGLDAWIMVLDTKGVNVWCAAGKGTFGTDEIVQRVAAVRLGEVVSHRSLVLPQLGAPGVAAHQVKNRCGFRVTYGPVRARDLRAFLAAGMRASPEMRRVEFPVADRLAVIPVEVTRLAKYFLAVAACLFFLAGLGSDGYSWQRAVGLGTWSAVTLLATWIGGTLLAPVLLPWLPGRPLALKGLWLGTVFVALFLGIGLSSPARFDNWLGLTGWCFIIPSITSFLAMNYAGSTTYTSLSGVRREMRLAAPLQLVCAILGLILWLAGRFV